MAGPSEMALVEWPKSSASTRTRRAEPGPRVRLPNRAASRPRRHLDQAQHEPGRLLSVRAMNCLETENIHTVRDPVQKSEDQPLSPQLARPP
jgi:hypothetical protein